MPHLAVGPGNHNSLSGCRSRLDGLTVIRPAAVDACNGKATFGLETSAMSADQYLRYDPSVEHILPEEAAAVEEIVASISRTSDRTFRKDKHGTRQQHAKAPAISGANLSSTTICRIICAKACSSRLATSRSSSASPPHSTGAIVSVRREGLPSRFWA